MALSKITASCWCLVAVSLGLGSIASAQKVFQIPFTTDLDYFHPGTYGPDGPWQAVAIMLGTHERKSLTEPFTDGPRVAMWPTGSTLVQVHGTAAGGEYTASVNATGPWSQYGGGGDNMLREADWYANHRSEGTGYFDGLTMINMRFELPGYSNINATLVAMNKSEIVLPDGRSYDDEVGNLGLGNPADTEFPGTGIVAQMKAQGLVGSNSFGLHLGSAALEQRGSLILGGYDASRVYGPVGVFEMQLSAPLIYLQDVFIGVETGFWPFNASQAEVGSVWEGPKNEAVEGTVNFFGGRKGSAMVTPNPAVPGIYLPGETCARAARHLPVTFDSKLGYYLWNTADPTYLPLLSSAAFLAFTFADTQAANITIKVPFQLLNLTLEAPIVDVPTPYFPCHDVTGNDTGYVELGRAFLQAAFFGINLDQSVTFLAQAPGPTMNQSVIRPISPADRTLTSNPLSAFPDSWAAHWSPDAGVSRSSTPLSAGAIAGIVIGALAGVALLSTAAWFLWRRRRKQHGQGSYNPVELSTGGRNRGRRGPLEVTEKESDTKDIFEVDGRGPMPEMDATTGQISEADGGPVAAGGEE
ncbi:aspartic peptidase domain-containing protein [Schizothecium vesticola]|uniref:Aspartic peptidase domain-containing protein n=1 Tax=Schizothecium vesticola TaxID=314040 RepID=A0AA40KCQ7_9PEZI|nr:aspartic peptidase domain-containing protein [Schizothecium vesticola]